MQWQGPSTTAHASARPDPVEGELFEALRQGSSPAFTALARRYQPPMLALALAYTRDEGEARDLIRRAWEIALPGLDMFEWRCSLRAWVTGILAGIGRPRAAAPTPPSTPRPPPPPGSVGDPRDWQDLPWGERWLEQAWGLAREALAGLPVAEREAAVLTDVAGWEPREVCDALGLTEGRYGILLDAAHGGVHDVLATWLGEGPSAAPATLRARRVGPVVRLLADLAPQEAPPDPALDAVFRRWRAARRRARFAAALRRLAPW